MIIWEKIIKKIPPAEYKFSNSRTSIWRRKNNIWKAKKLYFWVWLSFNIDGNRNKEIYKKQIENIKHSLNQDELNFLYRWIEIKYPKVSKNISIKDVNSKGKLFMHLLWILPYVKEHFKEWNIEWFIARILYNSTRSWYSNYCKKNKEHRLKEK